MPPRLRLSKNQSIISSLSPCSNQSLTPVRPFSVTTRDETRQRRIMFRWLERQGAAFAEPLPGSTNYLSAYTANGKLKRGNANQTVQAQEGSNAASSDNQTELGRLPPELQSDLVPFPLNRQFRSQPVISEELRESVWQKIMKDGQSVKTVSAELGIEMSRVGAIVRLKEVEKEWLRKGKTLAKPYAKAVMAMLPQASYDPFTKRWDTQESINDLPVHAATKQQIFHPTSESRHFTRADAARVFDETLLPADQRVPHPELTQLEKDKLAGVPFEQRVAMAAQRNEEEQQKKLRKDQRRREREANALKIVDKGRWEFRFREISVDDAGADGRGAHGTGWRYGVPHRDRKRAEVKIPTRVE